MTTKTPTPSAQQETVLTDAERHMLLVRSNNPNIREDRYSYLMQITEGKVIEKLRAAQPASNDAASVLAFGAEVIELFDDAMMNDSNYMLSSSDCAGILLSLGGYFTDGHGAPIASSEVMDALNWVDDFIARCNGNDVGACESVKVLRRALASAPVASQARAHVAREVQPVGRVRHFNYAGVARNGFSQEAVLNDDAPSLPDGTLLYAASQYSAPDPVIGNPRITEATGDSAKDAAICQARDLFEQMACVADDEKCIQMLAAVLADRQKRGGDLDKRAAFDDGAAMKPDWKDAPDWAKWLAMDANGDWWWYENEPTARRESFSAWGDGRVQFALTAEAGWEHTKEERAALAAPKPVNEQKGGGNG